MISQLIISITLWNFLVLPNVSSFGIPPTLIHDAVTSISPFLHQSSNVISISSSTTQVANTLGNDAANLLSLYKQSLTSNPLQTKMLTGGTIAVIGDSIAQKKTAQDGEKYDKQRAFSFMLFDMSYRAVQHASFPVIVQECRGQFLGAIASSIPSLTAAMTSTADINTAAVSVHDITYYLGAVEQTLASQLIIVPFFYYPVFFTLTGFVQGLTTEQAIDRAKTTFIPLMKRNLLFWLPVQFIQFSFVDENLQIPFLSVCGLAWTFILSVMAGSTKSYGKTGTAAAEEQNQDEIIEEYCITGAEEECSIDDEHLFPGVFETGLNGFDNNMPQLDYDQVETNDVGEKVEERMLR